MQITVKFYSQNANISSFKELSLELLTNMSKYCLFSRSAGESESCFSREEGF